MRSMQRNKRHALASFHDTYDIRRVIFTEHQRKLREVRQQAAYSTHRCRCLVQSGLR